MGTTKALIVGVSEYFIDGADNLFFCKNDIIAMQDAFIYGLEVAEKDMMQQATSDKENAEEYYAEAQQLLEELVDSGYDTIATRLNLATVLQALDQYSEAEKVLKDLQE